MFLMTHIRVQKIPVHSLLYMKEEAMFQRLLKRPEGQASGGGQTSSLLRVSSFVFELIQ